MAKATRAAEALSATPTEEDRRYDLTLRPTRLAEYIGQRKVVENLRVYMKAALKRREALDHVLLTGPPGLGKTTLAHIVANEMGAQLRSTSGPAIEKTGDIAALLTNLQEGDVLFIDEIHRLLPALEEKLYPAMEDFNLDLLIGQGPGARSIKLELPKFTLVGATTRAGLITSPLRGRFGIVFHLDFYPHEDLEIICQRSAGILNVEIDEGGAREIARRSRGTPRIVTIIEKFDGGPVGVGTLSAAIQEEKDSIEEIIEPYLIQIGFLNRTPRGRMATQLAYQHFGVKAGQLRPGLFDSA